MAADELGIDLAILRWQLKFRLNAGLPHDLTRATDEQRERYEGLLRAAQAGERAARNELAGRRERRRRLESLASG
jgi:hypothetical protein